MEKTYVFDTNEGGFNSSALLASLMQNRGVDPNLMAMLTNASKNQDSWGGGNCWWIWVIIMFWLWGGRGFGNGFGADGIPNQLNNDFGRDILLQAINGNATAISQLASTLNCDVNTLQTAIGQVQQSIQSVGNQVGMSGQQIINAIQSGTCQIGTQLAQCCCDIKDSITRSNYENQISNLNQTNVLQGAINGVATGLERGFSQIGYDTAQQTCALQNSFNLNTEKILAGQRAAEMRELGREIADRDRKIAEQAVIINNGQQTAIFNQMINQAVTPVSAALAGLTKEVAEITCKLPQTVTVPYSCATAIPTCVAAQYGFYGNNGLYGAWG